MGAPGILSKLAMFANLFIGARLRGRRGNFCGISALYKKDPKPLREDLPKIFSLLEEKKIDPLITRSFELLEAKRAVELLAGGSVEGKIVLIG
jgi:NADPH:quinone reductase-like Zn-dependent oxidoreductase